VIVGKTEKLDTKIKSVSHLLIPAYLRQEVEFARECNQMLTPEDLQQDFMLKLLAPFFEQGKDKVDWKLFEQKTKEVLENFFATINWFQYSSDGDVNVFVTAIDPKTGQEVGVIQLLTMPSFESNNVKVGLLGVVATSRSNDIKQLLISSDFKLFPDVQRIFLHTRSTDTSTIELYKSWGFAIFAGKLPHWIDLEDITQNADTLQKIAATLA